MTCDPPDSSGGTRSVRLRGLRRWDRPELRVPGPNAVSGLSPTATRREGVPFHPDDPGDLLHKDAWDAARRDTAHTQFQRSKLPAGGRGRRRCLVGRPQECSLPFTFQVLPSSHSSPPHMCYWVMRGRTSPGPEATTPCSESVRSSRLQAWPKGMSSGMPPGT